MAGKGQENHPCGGEWYGWVMSLATFSSYVQSHRSPFTSLAFIGTIGLGIVLLTFLLLLTDNADYPTSWHFSVRGGINSFSDWFVDTFEWFFDPIGDGIKFMLGKMEDFLLWLPWPFTLAGIFILVRGVAGVPVAFISLVGFSFMGLVGLWDNSMTTLSIMVIAVLLCVAIGAPIGVAASRNNTFDTILRPVLDAMQTTPSFVFLVPALALFGIGNTTAIVATVIYAVVPMVRLTNLGIRQVSPETIEAAQSFGCTSLQLLVKVRLPLALPSILMGVNQTIMFALIMVVFAGLVGGGGLGQDVVISMQRLEMGRGLAAGLAIVFMAIVFDRVGYAISERGRGNPSPQGRGLIALPMAIERFQSARIVAMSLVAVSDIPRRISQSTATGLGIVADSVIGVFSKGDNVASLQPLFRRHAFLVSGVAALLALVIVQLLASGYGDFPTSWKGYFGEPIDDAVRWITVNFAFIIDRVHEYFFAYVMGPSRDFLSWVPWPVLIICVFFLTQRSAGLHIALLAVGSLFFIGTIGMWELAMYTLAQIIVAASLSVAIGIPLGILLSRSNFLETATKPLLDAMQTMPGLVLFTPVIMFFGVGVTSAIVASVLKSAPPAVRLTNLGIRQVSPEAVDVAHSYGCTPLQTLLKVQLPMAIPSIMIGVNQAIMHSVSMVTYSALIGAGALGLQVLYAVSQSDVGWGIEAGGSLILIAIVMDRIVQGWSRKRQMALGF